MGSGQPPTHPTWSWSCAQARSNHQAPGYEIERPNDTAGKGWRFYRIWCSYGQSNCIGETGRLLRTRMAEHAAVVRKEVAIFQVAAHSTGPGHIFKFFEAKILANGDNRVSRELLESWLSGPQSINKRKHLAFPPGVLRSFLSKRISHIGRAGRSNNSDDSEHNCRAITRPASNADKTIVAIGESNAKCQASTASIKTPSGGYRSE
ncbi:unnamed protein product [Dibothriocephalus latus]|uniref:GIY-YIG domain-containing protein n=1 Tax=Dibothriocephalus latus TaxID=60516 RepID=A0A3P7LIY9_DIBLA|nr:unnamed protein product [Dibothriocephalus latus]